jgi:hypothetical protein
MFMSHYSEVFMPHRNARSTVHVASCWLIGCHRVAQCPCSQGVGLSRQCAHRWVARYAAEGEAGAADDPASWTPAGGL